MTLVKVCGITSPADAKRAVELGAWALGLVFYPESPRACAIEAAEEIGQTFRRRVHVTGVFVNPVLEEVTTLAERCQLDFLQLHGEEGPAFCREAARRTGCKIIKAMPVRDSSSLRALDAYGVDYQLLDAHVPGRPGGTGQTFNWDLVRAHPRHVPLILSGGLNPDNVARAIAATGPHAVDTASGTEAVAGRKDPHKLTAFFRAVASADQSAVTPAVRA